MIFIYIQTIKRGKYSEIPFRITVSNSTDLGTKLYFNIQPEVSLSKTTYSAHNLDKSELLSFPPFYDLADELIDLLQNNQLVFSELKQFKLLKSQFKVIGYNFNIKPKLMWYNLEMEDIKKLFQNDFKESSIHSLEFASFFIDCMSNFLNEDILSEIVIPPKSDNFSPINLSDFEMTAGVYYFLDQLNEVIYVGKAKNIRKRLQSHFSKQSALNNIDYSKVKNIKADYTGSDILAQLIESEKIKILKPIYNTQQINDSAPFTINKGKTAKGISRLKITRKDHIDNMPEKYFNRLSVKQSLLDFCTDYDLCRKHCGIESAKGPCSKSNFDSKKCVCNNQETIENYNERFENAFKQFSTIKSRKIYKLKGRHSDEDAFIYVVNGIYEGYGFINKEESILNENDILGNLILQTNNYETSRILNGLSKIVSSENTIFLNSLG